VNLFHYRIDVIRIVDGDTICANVDAGFSIWLHGVKFRLSRVNAPELPTPEGKDAKSWLQVELAAAAGKITCQSMGLDKYGRWLGEIFIDGANVNDRLVAAGHAKYVTY
jgi:endonuclease YncB( thermonuclease family)